MKKLFARLARKTEDQDLLEYALLAATIALGMTMAMGAARNAVRTEITSGGTSITAAP